jgi:hypothetical protein
MSTVQSYRAKVRRIAVHRLWFAGPVAGLAAFLGVLLLHWAVQNLFGITLEFPMPPDFITVERLAVSQLFVTTMIPALGATLLLFLLNRFLAQPMRIFYIVATLFLLVSFAGPLSLPADKAIIFTLTLMHIIAAAAIVTVLTHYGTEKE